jgi:hypothetical protein
LVTIKIKVKGRVAVPPLRKEKVKGLRPSQALVAHAYNPSFLAGRDEEDYCWKPALHIVRETLSQKNPPQKRAGGVTQGVGLEFLQTAPISYASHKFQATCPSGQPSIKSPHDLLFIFNNLLDWLTELTNLGYQ